MFNANDISARSYVLSDFSVCRLAPKLLQNHPDTKYVRKDKCHTLGRKLRIFKIDSSVLRLPDLVSSCVTKFAGQHSALVRVFQFPSSDSYSTCLNLTRTSYPNPTRKQLRQHYLDFKAILCFKIKHHLAAQPTSQHLNNW